MKIQIIILKTKLQFNSDEDRDKIIEVLKAERTCFNFCSEQHFGSKKNSIVELHAKSYHKIRTLYPNIKSQIIIKAENSCLAAYKSIKSNKQKIEKAVVKKRLCCDFDQRLFLYKNGFFRLTTLSNRVSTSPYLYPKLIEFFKKYKFGDIKISAKDNEIWISIPFKVEVEEPKQGLSLGVDLGVRRFASTSEGNLYIDKKFNKRKREIRHLKSKLKSKNTHSAKKHLSKLYNKERNINRNFVFHLANSILKTKCTTIVLEDLKVNQLKSKRTRYQNKNRISQVGFAELRRVLTYKAALLGKVVVCVSPYYTSQIDHSTGKLEGERKGCRFYSQTGFVYDADINAAINIAKRSHHPISQGNPLDGQATVIKPNINNVLISH